MAKAQKAPKGYKDSCNIEEYRGKYRLNIARKHSERYFGQPQKRVSTGLSACDDNFSAVEKMATAIHLDILADNFDVTLVRYALARVSHLEVVDEKLKVPQLGTLIQLWDAYCEVKQPELAETSFKLLYREEILNNLKALPYESWNEADLIKAWLLKNRSATTAKRVLAYLSHACTWAVRTKKIVENPFDGMAAAIKPKKLAKVSESSDDWDEEGLKDVRAFTLEERDIIIKEFEKTGYTRHLVPYVKLLFWTGCRPGEAAALRWGDVKEDCSKIIFRRNYNSRLRITKGTKTGGVRIFPCDSKLKELLRSIRPTDAKDDDLVVKTKHGNPIHHQDFHKVWRGIPCRGYRGLVRKLWEEGKISCYLKPYATRHTFITAQIKIGKKDPDVVAAWVGNTAATIYKHYCDAKAHNHELADI
jgi:integrase